MVFASVHGFSRQTCAQNVSKLNRIARPFDFLHAMPMSMTSIMNYTYPPMRIVHENRNGSFLNIVTSKLMQSSIHSKSKPSLKRIKNPNIVDIVPIKKVGSVKASARFGNNQIDKDKFNGNSLLLIDGSAIVYRAFFSVVAQIEYKKSEEIEKTEDFEFVTYSAFKFMMTWLERMPSHVVVCFDFRGYNFRHELYPMYKKNRKATPHLVIESIGYLRSLIMAMGISVLEIPGVEADDVIATLTKNALSSNIHVYILSTDKDFLQLLAPGVTLLRYESKGTKVIRYGMDEFITKFPNLKPHQFVDVMALMGDAADNVKGVKGIGMAGAISLITEYETLENLLLNVENVASTRYRNALMNGREDAFLTKRLVKLKSELPRSMVNCDWSKHVFAPPKTEDPFWNLLSIGGDSASLFQIKNRVKTLWKELKQRNSPMGA